MKKGKNGRTAIGGWTAGMEEKSARLTPVSRNEGIPFTVSFIVSDDNGKISALVSSAAAGIDQPVWRATISRVCRFLRVKAKQTYPPCLIICPVVSLFPTSTHIQLPWLNRRDSRETEGKMGKGNERIRLLSQPDLRGYSRGERLRMAAETGVHARLTLSLRGGLFVDG